MFPADMPRLLRWEIGFAYLDVTVLAIGHVFFGVHQLSSSRGPHLPSPGQVAGMMKLYGTLPVLWHIGKRWMSKPALAGTCVAGWVVCVLVLGLYK